MGRMKRAAKREIKAEKKLALKHLLEPRNNSKKGLLEPKDDFKVILAGWPGCGSLKEINTAYYNKQMKRARQRAVFMRDLYVKNICPDSTIEDKNKSFELMMLAVKDVFLMGKDRLLMFAEEALKMGSELTATAYVIEAEREILRKDWVKNNSDQIKSIFQKIGKDDNLPIFYNEGDSENKHLQHLDFNHLFASYSGGDGSEMTLVTNTANDKEEMRRRLLILIAEFKAVT